MKTLNSREHTKYTLFFPIFEVFFQHPSFLKDLVDSTHQLNNPISFLMDQNFSTHLKI